MPLVAPQPVTVIPAKTSGGSVKNPANLIGYSAAAQGPQAELWGNVAKAFKDLQSQVDGIANSLRAPLGLPDPIQITDPAGNLVANIGVYVNPTTNISFTGIWAKNFYLDAINRLYAEFTGTTQTITAGAGFTNVTSCSFTIPTTGTWHINCNAFVQQTAAAANTASIRFSRNGTGDVHTAGGGAGSGQYELHFDLQIALTSGDVIQLQCSAVTANATLLGTGNTGTTNISGFFLGI